VQIASEAKGKVGVAAMVLETGDTVSLNPRDHFPMQSVYKLPIGMAVMKQIDGGKVKLDQRVQVTMDNYVGKDSYNPVRNRVLLFHGGDTGSTPVRDGKIPNTFEDLTRSADQRTRLNGRARPFRFSSNFILYR
jgi:hypothetical protein